jgi:UDP-2-acetamido-3-amino-2,3-dideoxy-glucuronate N-acetyltransferase
MKAGARMSSGYWVHPSAVIDEPAKADIGEGTKIWHFCHVMTGARIGARCSLGQNVFVGGRAVLGDGCKVQNNVSLYDAVCLEDDVFVGPSAVFTNVVNPRAFIERKGDYRPTIVRKGASIGANATIVCGCEIGEYALVGAGAVVTRDVPAHALVLGVPGRVVGAVCRCAETLGPGRQVVCGGCQRSYERDEGAATVRLVTG